MTIQNESDGAESNLQHEKRFEESPINTVVNAVAEVTDQSPLEMKPLSEVIDPDALNQLFSSRNGSSSVSLTFEYCEHVITVTADRIQVAAPTSADD